MDYNVRNIKDKNLMLPTIFDLAFAVLLMVSVLMGVGGGGGGGGV